jgi:hypothetical protein
MSGVSAKIYEVRCGVCGVNRIDPNIAYWPYVECTDCGVYVCCHCYGECEHCGMFICKHCQYDPTDR